MIVNSISEAPANRAVRGLPDGTYEVWAKGEPQPAWYQEPVDSAAKVISAAEFRDRFTSAELFGITTLAYAGTGDPAVQLLLLKVTTNHDGIDLASADVRAGLDYLITKGKITPTRKVEILK